MKIGLIGYFGSQAYSDDLIEYVTRKLLLEINPDAKIDSALLNKCSGGTDPDYLNSFDLIIHAGGSLLGKCTHPPIRDIANWADKVKTPIAIFGTGYRYEPDKEPLNSESNQRLQLLFSKAEMVCVRGWRTIYYLKQNGVDTSKIQVLADPVMACDIKLVMEPKYLMGNVRNMPNNEIQHSTTDKVHGLMAEIYDWLIEKYNLPLHLISFRHNIVEDCDLIGAAKVKEKMKYSYKVSIDSHTDPKQAFNSMNHAVFWFGQRLHPTIFAATQGIPFVGVEYQFDKMLDWVSTVGIDNYIHTKDVTLESFISAFNRVQRNMDTLKHILPIRIKELHKVAEKIMDLV